MPTSLSGYVVMIALMGVGALISLVTFWRTTNPLTRAWAELIDSILTWAGILFFLGWLTQSAGWPLRAGMIGLGLLLISWIVIIRLRCIRQIPRD